MIKNGSFLVCEVCKKKYYVPFYRIKSSRFCSNKCHRRQQKTLFGEFTNNFKGGSVRKDGYKLLCVKGKLHYAHRIIVEEFLGRRLKKSEIIHHLDGNTANNSLENLKITNRSDHLILHNPLSKRWHK